MIQEYYRLPLQPGKICLKKEHPKCSPADSVAQMIHLIATTSFGECKHEPTFGCEIWEEDFENIANSQFYRDKLRCSIEAAIEKHEPRLGNVRAEIHLEQIDYMMLSKRVKSRIRLKLTGTLAKTNEPFTYSDQFFIGPLSYY